jgi:hypothetical protein
VPAGEAYVDVGTLHGYREAITTLGRRAAESGDGLGFPGILIRAWVNAVQQRA